MSSAFDFLQNSFTDNLYRDLLLFIISFFIEKIGYENAF